MVAVKRTNLREYALGFHGDEAWVVWLSVADTPEQVIFITATEGALADQHLVHQDTKRPPVHTLVVLQSFDNLLTKE